MVHMWQLPKVDPLRSPGNFEVGSLSGGLHGNDKNTRRLSLLNRRFATFFVFPDITFIGASSMPYFEARIVCSPYSSSVPVNRLSRALCTRILSKPSSYLRV